MDVYGVATISRLLKITDLFCKRALQKRLYSANAYPDLHMYAHICRSLTQKISIGMDVYLYSTYTYICIYRYTYIRIYMWWFHARNMYRSIDICTDSICTYMYIYGFTYICIYMSQSHAKNI